MWYIAIEMEDAEQLAYDLEPYPAAVLYQNDEPVRIHQYLVVITSDDAGFIATILETVCGYEIADLARTLEELQDTLE